MARLLTQRFKRDFDGRVKYSTLWPSRTDSPSAARRAMPTSRGLSLRGSKGREDISVRLLFAYANPATKLRQARWGRRERHGRRDTPVDSCWTRLRSSLLISSHPTQPTSSALFRVRGSFLIQRKLRVRRIQQNGSCKPDGPS